MQEIGTSMNRQLLKKILITSSELDKCLMLVAPILLNIFQHLLHQFRKLQVSNELGRLLNLIHW